MRRSIHKTRARAPAEENRASDGRLLIPYETLSPDVETVLERCQALLAADRNP